MPSSSFLSIVNRCDNFRLENADELFAEFRITPFSSHIIGLIAPDVVEALKDANEAARSAGQEPVWIIQNAPGKDTTQVAFNSWVNTPKMRTTCLRTLTEGWRDSGLFSNVISPQLWRNELYSIYIDAFGPLTEEKLAFALERTACALFGLVTYGVHMTMYTEDGRIWVPTRAKTKHTWPLYLDNSVAGGIPYGYSPLEALIKECAEEASLDEIFVKTHVKSRGSVSYFFKTPKGYLQPEVQLVYDLLIPPGKETTYVPRPTDGEVESFELQGIDAIVNKMHEGLFKPNCALVLVDFFIRHGIITAENEPYYVDIITRLHGRFGYEL